MYTNTCSPKTQGWNEFYVFEAFNFLLPLLSFFSTSFLFPFHPFMQPWSLLSWSCFSVFSLFQIYKIPASLLSSLLLQPLVFIISSVSTRNVHTHTFRRMSGINSFLQHHVVLHMAATPEPDECECFSRAHRWMDGWMDRGREWQDGAVLTQLIKGCCLNHI